MDVEIDYAPSPKKSFFISIELNKNQAISFDYTHKGHRITKQILKENKPFPKTLKPTAERDAIAIKNGKLLRKYHVKWIDLGRLDWVNGGIWETVWARRISKKTANQLLYYSRLFSDNYKELKKFQEQWTSFETYLQEEIRKYTLPSK